VVGPIRLGLSIRQASDLGLPIARHPSDRRLTGQVRAVNDSLAPPWSSERRRTSGAVVVTGGARCSHHAAQTVFIGDRVGKNMAAVPKMGSGLLRHTG
jgi:hypothetical protein